MTGKASLAYERYRHGEADEWLMRVGERSSPALLFLPPLFEEMNRMRAFIADVMRRLAAEGYCCWLPDLPGTGESERALEDCGWEDWRGATKVVADHLAAEGARTQAVASFRGGALLDDCAETARIWRLSPLPGAAVARDLARSGLVSGGGSGGYAPAEPLMKALQEARLPEAIRVRTVRLASDPAEADTKFEGPALWRRSEPGTSSELSGLIAADIAAWTRQCAAS